MHSLPRWSVLLIISLAVCTIFHQTLAGMIAIWNRSETYAHGFVIIPISAWLVFRIRARLESLPLTTSPLAVPAIVILSLIWVLARAVDILALEQFAFIGLWIGSIWLLVGTQITWALIFPLCYLFMAVPVGDELVPILIDHTAVFTISAIKMMGIPIYAEGNHFVIPTGRWSVVEACSGIRYLLASITIGLLFAYLNYQTWWRRLLFVLASIIVPIVANWLRAFGIVMLGYYSNNKIATGVDHLVYGWLFFGIVIFILFSVGMIWHEAEPVDKTPAVRSGLFRSSTSLPSMGLVLLLLLWLVALPRLADRHLGQPLADSQQVSLPAVIGDWQQSTTPPACEGEACSLFDWRPVFVGADDERFAYYKNAELTLGVHQAEYLQQSQGRELIAWQNQLLKPKDDRWSRLEQSFLRSTLGQRTIRVRQMTLQKDEQRLLLWQVYRVNDYVDGRKLPVKLKDAINRVLNGESRASSVVIVAPFKAKQHPPVHAMHSLLHSLLLDNYRKAG